MARRCVSGANPYAGAAGRCMQRQAARGGTIGRRGKIALEGSATTDLRGRFRLSNVPPGSPTLVIAYLGAPAVRMQIQVPKQGLEMGNAPIGGSTFIKQVIVYGQAAAFASALNPERSAINTVSVLDTDAMGHLSAMTSTRQPSGG